MTHPGLTILKVGIIYVMSHLTRTLLPRGVLLHRASAFLSSKWLFLGVL